MTATSAEPPVGNGARFAARPLVGGGTPAQVWLDAQRRLPRLDIETCPELVVVAAHPDDETLGFGAGAASFAQRGIRVDVVSASDGGASHPHLPPLARYRLERRRRSELQHALRALGLSPPISLNLPDGELDDHAERLTDLLTEILATRPAGTWCAANWRGDGHPDHEAVGRAAAVAAERTGAVLLEYPVWMWHWATPDDAAVPWNRAHLTPVTAACVARKKRAAQHFHSQIGPAGPDAMPVLPPAVLRRLMTVGEVVFR